MLVVQDLVKQYAAQTGEPAGGALGVSFEVRQGELFTLLGPSGCGKTTTLRCIAGLELPDSGLISVAGEEMFNGFKDLAVPMYDRDIGMVFQSYAIWPHMTVFENAAYPLRVSRRQRFTRADITRRVERALEMVGLVQYQKRSATQLSGGQQQRLALARALIREPKLLLLDEPLSNLDAQLREQMRSELKRIQSEWGVTTIYVTHDQSEAMAISDRIAVLDHGKIVQIGSPDDIYETPRSEFVANFIGRSNMLRGKLVAAAGAGGMGVVESEIGKIRCRFSDPSIAQQDVCFVVRPENVELKTGDRIDGENVVAGKVVSRVYLGDIAEFSVDLGGRYQLIARDRPGSAIKVGDAVTVRLPPENTIVITPP